VNAKREVDHSYWNSLLTLNGILISVFTAFAFISTFRIIASIIVLLSIYACWLIIANFKLSQKTYDFLGVQLDMPIPENPTSEQRKAVEERLKEMQKVLDPAKAQRFHKKVLKNQKIVNILFYVQMSFIIIILFLNVI
jgi:hypothetical protein